MNDHNAIGEAARDWVIEAIPDPENLSEMEDQVRRMLHWMGNIMLHLWLMWLAVRYPAARVGCPHCGGQAQYQRKRRGKLLTMFSWCGVGGPTICVGHVKRGIAHWMSV